MWMTILITHPLPKLVVKHSACLHLCTVKANCFPSISAEGQVVVVCSSLGVPPPQLVLWLCCSSPPGSASVSSEDRSNPTAFSQDSSETNHQVTCQQGLLFWVWLLLCFSFICLQRLLLLPYFVHLKQLYVSLATKKPSRAPDSVTDE